MSTNRQLWQSVVVAALFVVAVLLLWGPARWPWEQGAPKARVAQATTRPGRTWEIPALVSPGRYEAAADAGIGRLIERHNARQDRIAKVKLEGQCTWNLDMPGDPRPTAITFDRAASRASMTCGKDRCEIDGGKVTGIAESAMNVDALYLLMFRKYNAKEFAAAGVGEGGMRRVVARSGTETLEFDEKTGHLVSAAFEMKEGRVVAVFSEYKELPGGAGEALPMKVTVVAPAEVFPFERTRGGTVELAIDAKRSEARGSP